MRRLFFLALFCLSALSGLHAAPPPNIVFILSDDHSYPFLGCYGRPEMKTPHLDQFAAEGMKFHRMFTGAPQCVPSRATFLTGRSPVACRITRFSSPLPRDEITYPEILKKEAGYFVGVLGRSYHLDGSGRSPEASARVFEANQLQTFKERFDYVDSTGQNTIPETMKAFFDQRPKDKPYYLWVNFSDPHHPWDTGTNAPDPAKLTVPGSLPDLPGVRADLSRYESEIEHMDTDFKRVLDIVKERAGLDNTLIVFTGDNGMAFPSGKGSLHDPGLNVPLIVWWPGTIQPGSESRALISGEDVAPTCLEAAGLPVPNRISGKSFLRLLRGQPFQPRQHIFAERGPHGSSTFNEGVSAASVDYSRAVRSDRYKLIYNVTPSHRYSPVDSAGDPSWQDIVKAHEGKQLDSAFETLWFTSPRAVYELYDLDTDPSELRNLAGQPDMKDIEQQLKEALQEKMILDYDYLPLPIAGTPKKKAAEKNQAAKNDPNREKQFAQKDRDKDGVLSWDEFRQGRSAADAEGWFKARDQDANGSLSREEFITAKVPNPPKK
ncbi:sulfatase [Prosthecobacter algae]|uniref:Sulfatase n=1 Tax=Prosthecobacter algae TaxID=1144682 RepID=A0ABP9PJE2_9BACT